MPYAPPFGPVEEIVGNDKPLNKGSSLDRKGSVSASPPNDIDGYLPTELLQLVRTLAL